MSRKIAIIGAGLAGISAAIMLRKAGLEVEIFEKNDKIGGKLNFYQQQGYIFDLGPSILTLPQYFRILFEIHNRQMDDYIKIQNVRPHWRNFFEDGTVIDLDSDLEFMKKQLSRFNDNSYEALLKFLKYSEQQYDILSKGYFDNGLDTVGDFIKFYNLSATFKIDFFRTMHGRISKFFKNKYLIDIFDYFIKYVGSSAYNAPGFMNLMPTIQFKYDLWYVPGGMYNIARGFEKLMSEIGIKINLNSEVKKIVIENNKAIGIETEKEFFKADYIISNMEVIPAMEKLLNEEKSYIDKFKRFEPACSGLVIDVALKNNYPQLAHHNFFFAKDQKAHFDYVFNKKILPQDPTIYLVDTSKSDKTVAPDGCSGLKILPHIPYINEIDPLDKVDYLNYKEIIYDKLERMGLENLRNNIVFEHILTPLDIQKMYYSNKGSIYGVVSDFKKNFAFKFPKKSKKYKNLYFVGGSTNPGGGMPMVLLSGQNVAKMILSEL